MSKPMMNISIPSLSKGHLNVMLPLKVEKITIVGSPPWKLKITIPSPSTKQPQSGPSTKQSQPKSQFNLIDQLGKTPVQIYILELLHISPMHKSILDKTLQYFSILQDIDVNQFEAMVGYTTTPHHVTFSDQDYSSPKSNHNDTLHIEVFIHKHKVR